LLSLAAANLHLLRAWLALTSIAALLRSLRARSGLFIKYTSYDDRVLADPVCSVVISVFILASSIPLGESS
jgi:Co/Zn/Cd efflux system component